MQGCARRGHTDQKEDPIAFWNWEEWRLQLWPPETPLLLRRLSLPLLSWGLYLPCTIRMEPLLGVKVGCLFSLLVLTLVCGLFPICFKWFQTATGTARPCLCPHNLSLTQPCHPILIDQKGKIKLFRVFCLLVCFGLFCFWIFWFFLPLNILQ